MSYGYVYPDELDTFSESDPNEIKAVMLFIKALEDRGLISRGASVRKSTCMYRFKHDAESFFERLHECGLESFRGHIHYESATMACKKSLYDIKRPNDGNFNADGWYNYIALMKVKRDKYSNLGREIADEVIKSLKFGLRLQKVRRTVYEKS